MYHKKKLHFDGVPGSYPGEKSMTTPPTCPSVQEFVRDQLNGIIPIDPNLEVEDPDEPHDEDSIRAQFALADKVERLDLARQLDEFVADVEKEVSKPSVPAADPGASEPQPNAEPSQAE